MWREFYDDMTTKPQGVRPPVAGKHVNYVLLEAQGTESDGGDPLEAWLAGRWTRGSSRMPRWRRLAGQIRDFWAIRDAVADYDACSGRMTAFDIGLVVERMDELRHSVPHGATDRPLGRKDRPLLRPHRRRQHPRQRAHAGSVEPQPQKAMEEVVYGLVREFGGTVSAEHGIGTKKPKYLGYARSPEELALMRTPQARPRPARHPQPGQGHTRGLGIAPALAPATVGASSARPPYQPRLALTIWTTESITGTSTRRRRRWPAPRRN